MYRDAVNTPAFLDLLPDVSGKRGLDIGCGEGHNTRLLRARGARMFAIERAFQEIHRVLRDGGFLQFSILHPCFNPPHRRLLRTVQGKAYAVEVGRYFERVDGRVDGWLFSAAPPEAKAGLKPFEAPVFHRTLS